VVLSPLALWKVASGRGTSTIPHTAVQGYEGFKACEKMISLQSKDHQPKAIDRLDKLYTTTNEPEEEAKRRLELVNYPDVAPKPREKK
jgi:hypothetical protein